MTRVDVLADIGQPVLDVFDQAATKNPDNTDNIDKKATLAENSGFGALLAGKVADGKLPANPVGEIKWYFDDRSMKDLWIAVTWNG